METYLNFSFGETADMLKEAVQHFAAREIAPRAALIDRENAFPEGLWKKLGAMGLLGITVQEEFGSYKDWNAPHNLNRQMQTLAKFLP